MIFLCLYQNMDKASHALAQVALPGKIILGKSEKWFEVIRKTLQLVRIGVTAKLAASRESLAAGLVLTPVDVGGVVPTLGLC
jgi:hypothetical protein